MSALDGSYTNASQENGEASEAEVTKAKEAVAKGKEAIEETS